MTGKIILLLGPMFGSKSTALISYANRYKIAKKNTVLIKYSKDTRYSETDICSHDKMSITATFSSDNLKVLLEEKQLIQADVILIDEIQFFPDAPDVCDVWANQGKIVILAGLSGNFKREPFKVISELIPKAEEITHLKAVCVTCGQDAQFTMRMNNDMSSELIGGLELYEPRCRECFYPRVFK